MRIAVFTDTYTPQINGVVTSVQAFRAELERLGHDVHIFAPAARGARSENNVHRIRSFTFSPYPEYRVSVPTKGLIDEFEKINVDIIHVQTPVSAGTAGVGMAKHFGLPVVGTFHTLLPEYMHYLVKGRIQRFLMAPARSFAWKWCSWFYNRCDAVIAPSDAIAKILKDNGVSRPIRVIPTGISPMKRVGKKSVQVFRKKYRLSGKTILHVGRVTREKNIEAIIDAVEKLPDVMLAVASDGPHRAQLEAYVERKNFTDRVRFLGYLSESELRTAYAAADLFACASQSETQGIVLLEAAIAGLPIVALDALVVGDFVRENKAGIVADTNNFSYSIGRALDDKGLKRQVRMRAKSVARKYNIERCTKDLISTYEFAIARKKSGK